jgi:DNA-binding NtrC family response regulator
MEKDVSAKELQQIVPDITDNRLPALAEARYQSGGSNFTEREILYKLIFDLKSDLNDLKQFVYDIARHQPVGTPIATPPNFELGGNTNSDKPFIIPQQNTAQPIVVDNKGFHESETIEESLSLMDKERELIIKALKKHRNKRKNAADDLGISERTLYRKIKEYNIEI